MIAILQEVWVALNGGETVLGRFGDKMRESITESDVPLIKVLKTLVSWMDKVVEFGADIANLFEGGAIASSAERSLRSKFLNAVGGFLEEQDPTVQGEIFREIANAVGLPTSSAEAQRIADTLNQELALGEAQLRNVRLVQAAESSMLRRAPRLPPLPAPPLGNAGTRTPGAAAPNVTVRADTKINVQGPVTPETISDIRKGAEDGVGAGLDAAGERFAQ